MLNGRGELTALMWIWGAIYTPEAKQSQSLGGLGGCGDTLFFINLPATWVQCQLNIKPQQIKTSSV